MANTKLEKMIDSIINGNQEEAQTYFHSYMKTKAKNVFEGKDSDDDDDDDKKSDDDDDD